MNIAALEDLEARYPDANLAFVESGGDNLTLTFSPELVDWSAYVIDVAGGDKVPRKRGPGLVLADLLVINKTDLAPYVGADLDVMARDGALVRAGRPIAFTNCRTGEGLPEVVDQLETALGRFEAAAPQRGNDDARFVAADHDHGHAHVHR